MPRASDPINKARAAKDGNEYHETWTARHAMKLLLPGSELVGIAVEGLAKSDERTAGPEAVEVADLTFYFGNRVGLEYADQVRITQFKYSIRDGNKELRAASAKETLKKFGATYKRLRRAHGAKLVNKKLAFEFHTNRPIFEPLQEAIEALSTGRTTSGEVKNQANQFQDACGLSGSSLMQFATRCRILSLNDTLRAASSELTQQVVDWSGGSYDAIAKARLGTLRRLVREKAGTAGDPHNVIEHTDILAAFGLSEAADLLPCPSALTEVAEVITREQLPDALRTIRRLRKPMMIHASGGTGKTVFMSDLCSIVGKENETVFFDCFGGGNYRAAGDGRHLPARGLVHIANTLACRGLCDPILPGEHDTNDLFRVFGRRLSQCVKTLSTVDPNRQLAIFLDAIDNAAGFAKDRREVAFPVMLASYLDANPLAEVKLILSSRSHRIPLPTGSYEEFELHPFSKEETGEYLRSRLPRVTRHEIQIGHVRSAGNARVLDYMIDSDRHLLEQSDVEDRIKLDDLILARIERALSEAKKRGNSDLEIGTFLAGLAILPPPVPIDEYSEIMGIEKSAVDSFATDLWPLLERTQYGLTFRDEPTEQLVRDRYADSKKYLREIKKGLLKSQTASVYSARALPDLLFKLSDSKGLFRLAFDDRIPSAIDSTVGIRKIRGARLLAATRHAAAEPDFDQLVQLTVELSSIAIQEERGDEYILDSPDLVIAAEDTDALRRLFESRTGWQGKRHARLTISNALSGDLEEALRHAVATQDWLRHHRKQSTIHYQREEGPSLLDEVAIPFYLFCAKQFEKATAALAGWKHWYSYEISERVLELSQHPALSFDKLHLRRFLASLSGEIGCLAAALSTLTLARSERLLLLDKLETVAGKSPAVKVPDRHEKGDGNKIEDGLRKSVATALSYGRQSAALRIATLLPVDRPSIHFFGDRLVGHRVSQQVFSVAIKSAATGDEIRQKDLLPKELVTLAARIPNELCGEKFCNELMTRLEKHHRVNVRRPEDSREIGTASTVKTRDAKKFLTSRLGPLLRLTRALAKVLRSRQGRADKPFKELVKVWSDTREQKNEYHYNDHDIFFRMLGRELAEFCLWARGDLKIEPIRAYLTCLHEQDSENAPILIRSISIIAKRTTTESLAGEEAVKCLSIIENENDVGYRVDLFSRLARAILPASKQEAARLFRIGLKQMDAIGSGDYLYANHLLLLTASLRQVQLSTADSHTLTNLVELNLSDEPEKFPWEAFGAGLSRASGYKALAKLSRWDDRGRVSLEHTLLPYIVALISDKKIAPENALSLMWLVDPSESWSCHSGNLANAIENSNYPNSAELIKELVLQFEANNPGLSAVAVGKDILDVVERTIGEEDPIAKRLSTLVSHCGPVSSERNENLNHRSSSDTANKRTAAARALRDETRLNRIAKSANPTDMNSLCTGIGALLANNQAYSFKERFFEELRSNVVFKHRSEYLFAIAENDQLNLYWKIEELAQCKKIWASSSIGLTTVFKQLAVPLIHQHIDDLVSSGYLSRGQLAGISKLSEMSMASLAIEMIKCFSGPGSFVPSGVWLDLASLFSAESKASSTRDALSRLLNSEAARHSESVQDGTFEKGLYCDGELKTVSGVIWRQLGSPKAADRWRAAHSIRRLAKFECWEVIDAIVSNIERRDAIPFQAPELTFYFMHAKLWLLITIARIAIDKPQCITRYKSALIKIVDDGIPHVLHRHFAAKALLEGAKSGGLGLSEKKIAFLSTIDCSTLPKQHKPVPPGFGDAHVSRPDDFPEPAADFGLDYDFNKYDVHSLSKMFGLPNWQTKDAIATIVSHIDPTAQSMHDSGGRTGLGYYRRGMESKYHSYGEQLGWHALMIAAGQLLDTETLRFDDPYEDRWEEWLRRYQLTRSDGLWLSEGRDRTPIEIITLLGETRSGEFQLTGRKSKILNLVGLSSGVHESTVAAGRWYSADHIKVEVSSVLVKRELSGGVISGLLAEDPCQVWLPFKRWDDEDEEYLSGQLQSCLPWIVDPDQDLRLDGDDPFASPMVAAKFRPATDARSQLELNPVDPFCRDWVGPSDVKACSEAWGFHEDRYGSTGDGKRLTCNRQLIEKLLTERNSDLVILVVLEKIEKGYRYAENKRWNTVAIVQITKALRIKYFKGQVNRLSTPKV